MIFSDPNSVFPANTVKERNRRPKNFSVVSHETPSHSKSLRKTEKIISQPLPSEDIIQSFLRELHSDKKSVLNKTTRTIYRTYVLYIVLHLYFQCFNLFQTRSICRFIPDGSRRFSRGIPRHFQRVFRIRYRSQKSAPCR